jgi:hypothetical protein
MLSWLYRIIGYHMHVNMSLLSGWVLAAIVICGVIWLAVYTNDLSREEPPLQTWSPSWLNWAKWSKRKHKIFEACARFAWLLGSLLAALLAFCGIAGIIIMLVPQIFTWSFNYAIANPTVINQAFAGFAPICVIYIGFALAIQLSIKLLLMPYPEGWEKR